MTEQPATKKPREEGAADGEKDVIMVTGGSGLVGQAIRMYVESNKKDNEEWIYLSSKDGDLRVRADTDAIFAKYKPTHVIHLAAKVGGLFANMAQKVCRPFLCVCEEPTACTHAAQRAGRKLACHKDAKDPLEWLHMYYMSSRLPGHFDAITPPISTDGTSVVIYLGCKM